MGGEMCDATTMPYWTNWHTVLSVAHHHNILQTQIMFTIVYEKLSKICQNLWYEVKVSRMGTHQMRPDQTSLTA